MRILHTGATGYLGQPIHQFLVRNGHHLIPFSSKERTGYEMLNLQRLDQFNTQLIHSGDIVLMAAAESAPDKCANELEYVRSVNVDGTIEFITLCVERGARVIFFSSDVVYGEKSSKFNEGIACNPCGEYALMKHEVESHFLGMPEFKTIRLSYVFSRDDKFTKYLIHCDALGSIAEVYNPFYRSAISRQDVIQGVSSLVDNWDDFPQPIINFGGPKMMSRIDIANTLKASVLPNLNFRQVNPEANFFLNRPRRINMQSPLLETVLGRPCQDLAAAIEEEFLEEKELFK